MSFQTYTLGRSAQINGRRINLSMAVDCVARDVSVLLLINGLITPLNANPPKFWEVDTPAKAEEFFRRINLDAFAQGEPA